MIQSLVSANATIAGYTSPRLIVVAKGSVYLGEPTGVTAAQAGTSIFSSVIDIQAVPTSTDCFFLDGTSTIKRLELATNTMIVYAASEGTAPTGCRLGTLWRGRLVLAGSPADPQNFFASKVGDPFNWDYADQTPTAAFAGNASQAGRIGDRITALMPFVDDVLVIGGSHSIYRVVGDPAAGGQIVRVSDQIGVIGPNAWTQDPAGNLYFLGTDGLYRMQSDGAIKNLSATRLDSLLGSLDRTGLMRPQLRWDRQRHGLWIFLTFPTSGPTVILPHVWYDARTDGFFPMEFPARVGPSASHNWDGGAATDQRLLLGGVDGSLYVLDETALTDDGDPIFSHVNVGPFAPVGAMGRAKLIELDITLGERGGLTSLQWHLDYSVRSAEDAYAAYTNPTEERTGTWLAQGRQDQLRVRQSGGVFMLKLSSQSTDTTWGLDQIVARFQQAGGAK